MKRFKIIMIALFFAFLGGLANASSMKNDDRELEKIIARELELVDILDLAISRSPKLRQSWINTQISEADYRMQRSDFFPEIDANLAYSWGQTDYDDGSVVPNKIKSETLTPSLSLSWLLFDFGARESSVLQFKHRLEAAKYDQNSVLYEFVFSVIQSYYDVLSSMAIQQANIEVEASSLEAFKSAELRHKLGLVPLTDKLQAETSYSQSRLDRQRADNDVNIKKAQLNYLLNIPPNVELLLAQPKLDMSSDLLSKNVDGLMEIALKNRPDLRAQYESREATRKSLSSTQLGRLPTVSLSGSYGWNNDLRDGEQDSTRSSIGLKVSMPLFTGGYISNNVARKKQELQLIDEQIKDLEISIGQEVWNIYQNFQTAGRVYQTSQTLLDSASENEKVALGRYKNGKSSILDLLDAQSKLATARKEYISSQYSWFVARSNLVRALGYNGHEELKQLNAMRDLVNDGEINSKEKQPTIRKLGGDRPAPTEDATNSSRKYRLGNR